MSEIPTELLYSTDHEWVRTDGETATVGITDYAQAALGDIVYVQLPALGDALAAGQECGEVESTKSVSPLIAPVSGEVIEVNDELDTHPEAINSAPYGSGWLMKVRLDGDGGTQNLLGHAAYGDLTA